MNTQPGWYPDQQMTGTQRYWDGSKWTDHVAPAGQGQVAPADRGMDQVIVVGLVFAVLLPIVGFIIGLTQINRSEGIGVVLASLVAALIWWLLLAY